MLNKNFRCIFLVHVQITRRQLRIGTKSQMFYVLLSLVKKQLWDLYGYSFSALLNDETSLQ